MALSDLDRMAQERDHFKTRSALAMKSSARHLAIARLATALAWTTADGKTVRITHVGDDMWCVDVGDHHEGIMGTREAAFTLALKTAPPEDTELADLLTWTACGHSRV